MEKPVSLKPEHIRDEKVKLEFRFFNQFFQSKMKGWCSDNMKATRMIQQCALYTQDWKGFKFKKSRNNSRMFLAISLDVFCCNWSSDDSHRLNSIFFLIMQVKQPGLEMSTAQSELDLSYMQRYQGVVIPEAYEGLILDTIKAFTRTSCINITDVQAAWEIFTPLLHRIDKRGVQIPSVQAWKPRPCRSRSTVGEKVGYVQTHGYIWIPPTL
ncbi:hypothetical protein SASPL_128236 [Salvia splendens]|uniref:glucose-6-phosphate dehydrogenase (NADP(+)) n=1 Tax=Salvia splendens TaxID=180675 RepID=A0A8X8XCP9_SALSN|nr:hypothetical protein SASPL_128236 [Salvia splendens]